MPLSLEQLDQYDKAFSGTISPEKLDQYDKAFSSPNPQAADPVAANGYKLTPVDHDPFAKSPGMLETAGRGLVMGTMGIGQGIGASTRWAGDVLGSKPIAEAGRVASEYWDKSAQEMAPRGPEFTGTFVENPSVKKAVLLIAQAAPSLAAALTIGTIAGPAAAAGSLGLLEGAPQYEEARAAGKSVTEASGLGVASTAGTALLEFLPISRFLKGIPGGIVTRAGKGAVMESGQEVSQSLWQNLIAKYGYDETRNLAEGLVESAIAGGGVGAIAGTVFRGVEPQDLNTAKADIDNQIIETARKVPPAAPQAPTILPAEDEISRNELIRRQRAETLSGRPGQDIQQSGIPVEEVAPGAGITGIPEETILQPGAVEGGIPIRGPVQEPVVPVERRKEVADVITPDHIDALKGLGYDYDDIFLMNPRDADYVIENGRKPAEIDTSKQVKGPKEPLPPEIAPPEATHYYPYKSKSAAIENSFNEWAAELDKHPSAYKYNKENSSDSKIDTGYNEPVTPEQAFKQLKMHDNEAKSNAGRMQRGGKAGFNVSPTETLKAQWYADKLRSAINQWRNDFPEGWKLATGKAPEIKALEPTPKAKEPDEDLEKRFRRRISKNWAKAYPDNPEYANLSEEELNKKYKAYNKGSLNEYNETEKSGKIYRKDRTSRW